MYFQLLPSAFAFLLFSTWAPSATHAISLPRDSDVTTAKGPGNAASLRACAVKALGPDAFSRLVTQSNSTYDDARLGEKIQYKQFPTLIAYAKQASDVQGLVKCANSNGFKAVPRSGGHHFESFSALSNTLVIDIGHIDYANVSSDRQKAVVGAGIRLGRLYLATGLQNTSFVGGICPTVALSGLLAAGGFNMQMRSLGLSVDYVETIKAVTSSGDMITASPTQNSDLFWAMLGGGGGTYAIATEFTIHLTEMPRSSMVFLTWTDYNTTVRESVGYQVAKRFLEWGPSADQALTSGVNVFGDNVQVIGWYYGKTKAQLEKLIQSSGLLEIGKEANRTVVIEGGCNTHNSRLFGYTTFKCQKDSEVDPTLMNVVQDPFSPLPNKPQFQWNETPVTTTVPLAPAWTRFLRLGKSFFVLKSKKLAANHLAEVIHRIEVLGKALPASAVWGEWSAWNIAQDKKHGVENAFAWREEAWAHLQFQVHGSEDKQEQKTIEKWFDDLEGYLRPKVGPASYTGYMDNGISVSPQTSYFGNNICKLVAVKKKYDPQNRFTNPHAIAPTAPKGVKC